MDLPELIQAIEAYIPCNGQEEADRAQILAYLRQNPGCLRRDDLTAHVTVSAWVVNRQRTHTLMVHHNIYNAWSWIGGHADGQADLAAVALREVAEETGAAAALAQDGIFSLEILAVAGHEKKGLYVPSHLHLNVTFLAEADAAAPLAVNPDENRAVRWIPLQQAAALPDEPWMTARIYCKLAKKCRQA